MLQALKSALFSEIHDGKKYFIGGLEDHVEDERDFSFTDLGGWFTYDPKHDVHEIKTISVKDQHPLNTCVYNSLTTQKEADEGVVLSPRSVIRWAYNQGYIRGNGFSTLREGQKAAQKFGIAENSIFPNVITDWWSYARGGVSANVKENANAHRSESYFSVRSKNEVLKALDENRIIHTGTSWYSGYNARGGFKAPWVLQWGRGYRVGGHAYCIIGYDIPRGLLKMQNSFGDSWGDKGCFYVRMADWFRSSPVGYVSVDLDEPETLEKFIASHEGKNVKANEDSTIYLIQGGKKRPYINAEAFLSKFLTFDRTYQTVSKKLLDIIPLGDSIL